MTRSQKLKEVQRKLAFVTQRAYLLAQDIWLQAATSRRKADLRALIADQNLLLSELEALSKRR